MSTPQQALLNNKPRAATITADGNVQCLALHRQYFVEMLGNLEVSDANGEPKEGREKKLSVSPAMSVYCRIS